MFDLRWCWHTARLLALMSVVPASLRAEDDQDELSPMRREFAAHAQQFRLQGGESGTRQFDLVGQPVLSWSNPERRTSAGAMFFWTLDGRPQAAMCMYPTGESRFDLEFQSLSLFPLLATTKGGDSWDPAEAGIEFRKMDGTSPPGASIPIRLRQMRNLARAFSAQLTPPGKTPVALRLMSAPLYRYPTPDPSSGVIDGAVFSFVQATDPEVLLVIEALTGSGGEPIWQYGLARMSMVPLQVMRQKMVVWKQANWASTRNRRSPYYVIPKFVLVEN